MTSQQFIQVVKEAGIVGAGGAGFPTYKKLENPVETVIINGAECEPLLFKDVTLMENHAADIIDGLQAVMDHTGARQGIVAIKRKNHAAIKAIRSRLKASMHIFEMEDVYPAGDEYEVVFHATGKRIPAGGFPFEIGILVQNVETIYNIRRAIHNQPVTHSMVTVSGAVNQPYTAWVPLGTPYAHLLEQAGGVTANGFVILDGGPMMGKVVEDLETTVGKTTSGLVVIPRDAHLAARKTQDERTFRRIGKSTCDQCSLCTEMCPRYLMGYPIQPHLVMRSLLTSDPLSKSLTPWAQACCECNICSLWACPEELDPRNVCATTKRDLKAQNMWQDAATLQTLMQPVHPVKDYRAVPTRRLMRKLGIAHLYRMAPYRDTLPVATELRLSLRQHIGAPAIPVVRVGDAVQSGDPIARAAEDALSVPVHAPCNGVITTVDDNHITLISD
ncbi:MAG: NADH dehydrogenase subunit [Calditrichaeota bacterium]|nr:MAG: NADH dehydrogenase subunit [Calditrichota bacterium]